MESKFGYDFSKVRIHADERAAESANSINALAYTVGNNIIFGAGQYCTDTLEGKSLIAYELAHVRNNVWVLTVDFTSSLC